MIVCGDQYWKQSMVVGETHTMEQWQIKMHLFGRDFKEYTQFK